MDQRTWLERPMLGDAFFVQDRLDLRDARELRLEFLTPFGRVLAKFVDLSKPLGSSTTKVVDLLAQAITFGLEALKFLAERRPRRFCHRGQS